MELVNILFHSLRQGTRSVIYLSVWKPKLMTMGRNETWAANGRGPVGTLWWPGGNVFRGQLHCCNLVLTHFCYREGSSGFRHYHIKETTTSPKKYYLSEKHAFGSIPEIVEYHKHNAAGKWAVQTYFKSKVVIRMIRLIVMNSPLSSYIL